MEIFIDLAICWFAFLSLVTFGALMIDIYVGFKRKGE
jgi:hypothetical protein